MKAYLVFDDIQFHTSLWYSELEFISQLVWVFIYAVKWAFKPETVLYM